ncbi:MarR family winged helix-turn-helix transcriptional regulator [Kineococcus sp. SYSU DK001]|uniref:MarR family winged helix-turn-helix transcriptional regulator n=1 Tax=Kineococcus sp. SYSU DK001 TaxID=3383122 RepID=UPI003D7D0E18
MDDLDGELLETLRSVQWRLRRRSHGDLHDLGVTPAQGRVLRVVGRCDDPPRMGAVAEHLHIAPRSLTDLADPLEQAGLLRRTPDPDNRRSTLLDLTPAGRAVLDELHRRSRESAAAAFAVLDPDDRRRLLDLLRRLEGALAAPAG